MRRRVFISPQEYVYRDISDAEPCPDCPGNVRVKEAEIVPGLRDPLPGPYLTEEQARSPREMARHVRAFEWLKKQLVPVNPRLAGDGIVICGGGKYWTGIMVSLRMLRESGCMLPVQIWHRGEEAVSHHDLAGYGPVTLHNASLLPHRRLVKWEIKALALLNCGLERVFLLDADAYCLEDPTPLFDLLRQYHTVFWQDLHNQDHRIRWEAFGLTPNYQHHVPPIQGGHVLLSLTSHAYGCLVLMHWMGQHSDFYGDWHCYGDQDWLRAAMCCRRHEFKNLGLVDWDKEGGAYVCRQDGRPLIVHRCRSKMEVTKTSHLPGDDRAFRQLRDYLGTP